MEPIETYAVNYFNDFELSVVNEPVGDQLLLFDKITSNVQSEQFEIFKKIEKNAPFINAGSFSNQVHFQNAYQIANLLMLLVLPYYIQNQKYPNALSDEKQEPH